MNIILYIASSLDGYIARPDGAVDWLELEQGVGDYGYEAFYASVDALVMGRKTYDFCLSVDEWPYAGKQTFVLTGQNLQSQRAAVKFLMGDVRQCVQSIANQGYHTLWLVGGGTLVQEFCRYSLIDQYIIFIMPILLGTGIPLFPEFHNNIRLELASEQTFPGGVVKLHYGSTGGTEARIQD
jgi:dihydrofolate reductase